ncbi:MAG TPA: hypothetical protein VIH57_00745 [Bacteroidales bacterium]
MRHLVKFEKKTRTIFLADNHSAIIARDSIDDFLNRFNPGENRKK